MKLCLSAFIMNEKCDESILSLFKYFTSSQKRNMSHVKTF